MTAPSDPSGVEMGMRPMVPGDHVALIELWTDAPGVRLRDADTFESFSRFLARNPNLSLVACEGDTIVGSVLCGHDGRRGYLHHVVVVPERRRQGLGRALVAACIQALERQRITKTHVFVFDDNEAARGFWTRLGWRYREEIAMYSCTAVGASQDA